jgi:hypothetical protein
LAQAPVQVAIPAGSTVYRYSVSPVLVARTVPIFGTETFLTLSTFAALAEAGGEEASAPTARVIVANVAALTNRAALVFPVSAAVFPVRERRIRNAMS